MPAAKYQKEVEAGLLDGMKSSVRQLFNVYLDALVVAQDAADVKQAESRFRRGLALSRQAYADTRSLSKK